MTELLDTTQITQPFDLLTAVKYMRENGEYIRYRSNGYDFYMYISKEQKPVVVSGKRQLKEFEKIYGVSQYGGSITNIPLADLLDAKCYIMQFDENGDPIWSEPTETTASEA
ncbi:hypothetical protein Javan226_0046 [Streptococcus phage Javan226]|uniref:Phage protein n=1 Tax=Streptococcus gallolyticus TaxID=315405 RepID=A0A139R3T7_9STRE|nr:hypothetical protein [Streptococcus gallolyticus]KXU09428.1 Phage protein [Streptococcus gallolyticus]QBX25065.1 hypothetical protein Javan226_0046 [Streptococcus phage Javan226]